MRSVSLPATCVSISIAVIAIALLAGTAPWSQDQSEYPWNALTDQFFATMGRSLDLVVRGVVNDVEAKWITGRYSFGVSGSTIVTQLSIAIEEVLAGEYAQDTITAYLTEGTVGLETVMVAGSSPPPAVEVGDTVIIGLLDYMEREYRYINQWPRAFFRIEGGELVPYKTDYFVVSGNPVQIMKASARKRTLPYLYRNAEYVCAGSIIQNDADSLILHLRVDEPEKGVFDEPVIRIDYTNDVDLRKHKSETGTRLLVFLKRSGERYRLYSGMNSVYFIQGDALIRWSLSPLVTTYSRAKDIFMRLKEEKQ